MQHRVLEYYQICSNDAQGSTLTYFTARSNLVLYAFLLENVGWFREQARGDLGEIVSLQTQTSPYFQLKEKIKYIEQISTGKAQLKTSP